MHVARSHWVLRRRVVLVLALAAVTVAISLVLFACSQTPTSVPVRTFERAQRMDVACLQLFDSKAGFAPIEPRGRPQDECVPVATDVNGGGFEKQLFALVTQTTRGEIAVVDLSAGGLVDQSRATPGINFLPVGALPTDVATTPDGKMAFVGSAETNKAAIYGIPTRRLLGDTQGFPHDPEPPTLGSWPVCALPQNPAALAIVPRRVTPGGGADAGTADAEAGVSDAGDAGDAGATPAPAPDYELVVVLPGDRRSSAKIVTIDPRPFLRGGLKRTADGKPDYASDPTVTPGDVLEPGSLAPCPILAAIELSGGDAVPASFVPGVRWDDGVKYLDGGIDLTCNRPTQAARCGAPPCCPNEAGVVDTEAGACEPVKPDDAGAVPLDLGPLDPPRLVSIVRDEQTLYVADEAVPFIHVLDLSTSGQPRELPPLLATSLADPSRAVMVREIAISPPTRDYKRFLYAVDRTDGSIMVYDVTDPHTTQRTPLRRPHPELNPFQPPDRLVFNSPVVALAFARHDVPLAQINGFSVPNAASGVLCNPNPNVGPNSPDLGYYYRASSADPRQDLGPRRLRGIYGFATLANGRVVTIDVDDWDAPCRRPVDMSVATSDIAPPQPAPLSNTDVDPYHAPITDPLAVTNEGFFPMAAPHSLRSEVLVRDDSTTGNQLPRLTTAPTVAASGIILPQTGPASGNTPLLTPPNLAREEPQVHIDQDWQVTWEGAIPGFDGVSGVVGTDDAFASLVVTQPTARFCAKGVEDWAQGKERASSITRALTASSSVVPPRELGLVTDYLQVIDEILPSDDPYWGPDQDCWDPQLPTAAIRHDTCERRFGAAADQSALRDFPILEAYDDRVVLGRYFSRPEEPQSTPPVMHREVVYKDPTNAVDLKLMACCFHKQVKFRVRTGQLWSVVGTAVGGGPGVGFFSHLTTDAAGRCVPSCEPRESLLNGRVPMAPNGVAGIARNSPLGIRNPMMDFAIIGGENGVNPARDTQYTFSTRGQFRSLFVDIGGGSTSVNPQSMRYIESLGQIGVVDGASQGLVLIDLRAVTVARAPYF